MTFPAVRPRRSAPSIALMTLALVAVHPSRVVLAQLPAPAVSAPTLVHLGGYGSLVAHAPRLGDSTRISESSLALLASGTLSSRLVYFAELDAVHSSRENYAGRQDDRAFEIARLYAEYTIADAARIRVGRFLTPVGQWNESPAEPVTWTAVRPLTTYRPFAKEVTGLLIAGTHDVSGHDAGYALYAATSTGRNDTNEVRFTRALGGRFAVELLPRFWIGASAAAVAEVRPFQAEDDTEESGAPSEGANQLRRGLANREGDLGTEGDGEVHDQHARGLLGADIRLQMMGVDFLGEAVSLSSNAAGPGQRGAFAQAAVPTGIPDVVAVGRMEWYSPPNGGAIQAGTLGLTYRAPNRLTLKLERQLTNSSSARVARGWYAAVSLLF